MRCMLAALLSVAFVGSASALNANPHYLGLDPATHACAVLIRKTEGWKIMGTYPSTEAAKKAMARMKACKGQPV
jgi:hypothetical protein